ncbi:FAD-dependent oxidoreductase [Phreatobacter sp.]|uniref:FAD-dependent oxidoreductase n=1 Tax=Phreatobacter sp. TaxID=1966341 RepID=UPI0025F9E3C4|nr:FAD-dependent oxidoreductase [Phreatobacter sp.]
MSTAASLLPVDTVDACIVGDDPGGLSVALTLAAWGAPVALIRPPAAGLTLQGLALRLTVLRDATAEAAVCSWPAVQDRVAAAVRRHAVEEASHRLAAAGIRVIEGAATFTGPRSIAAGGRVVQARRFVIATGSQPQMPTIPGLADIPVLTTDTVWDLAVLPSHLAVIGGDAAAAALAQGFRRLGARVSLFAAEGLLPGFDADMAAALRDRLVADGVALFEQARVTGVAPQADGIALQASRGNEDGALVVSHVLVSAGRLPALAALGLEAAGIVHGPAGIPVDAALLTANRRIFALGETGDPAADAGLSARQGALVAQNILFRKAVRGGDLLPMRLAHTTPAVVELGLGETEARRRDPRCRVLRLPAAASLPAGDAGALEGHVKLIVTAKGRMVGAAILGRDAAAIAAPIALAIGAGLKVHHLAAIQLPYPSVSDMGRRAAIAYFGDRLSNPSIRRTIRLLRWFG